MPTKTSYQGASTTHWRLTRFLLSTAEDLALPHPTPAPGHFLLLFLSNGPEDVIAYYIRLCPPKSLLMNLDTRKFILKGKQIGIKIQSNCLQIFYSNLLFSFYPLQAAMKALFSLSILETLINITLGYKLLLHWSNPSIFESSKRSLPYLHRKSTA